MASHRAEQGVSLVHENLPGWLVTAPVGAEHNEPVRHGPDLVGGDRGGTVAGVHPTMEMSAQSVDAHCPRDRVRIRLVQPGPEILGQPWCRVAAGGAGLALERLRSPGHT